MKMIECVHVEQGASVIETRIVWNGGICSSEAYDAREALEKLDDAKWSADVVLADADERRDVESLRDDLAEAREEIKALNAQLNRREREHARMAKSLKWLRKVHQTDVDTESICERLSAQLQAARAALTQLHAWAGTAKAKARARDIVERASQAIEKLGRPRAAEESAHVGS